MYMQYAIEIASNLKFSSVNVETVKMRWRILIAYVYKISPGI